MVTKLNITSPEVIGEAIVITGASLLPALQELPGIKDVPGAYELVVYAGQLAYAEAYKYVYYVSIAFVSSQRASWVISPSTWTIMSLW
jgi:hypothetical protein